MSHPARPAVVDPELLARVGRALFGEQWQSQLARALGMSDRSIRFLLAGDRPVHIALAIELQALCDARAEAIDQVAEEIDQAMKAAAKE